MSVNLFKEYLWDDHGPINYQANKQHTISQDLPNLYRVTNGIYMAPKKEILSKQYLLGKNPYKSSIMLRPSNETLQIQVNNKIKFTDLLNEFLYQ